MKALVAWVHRRGDKATKSLAIREFAPMIPWHIAKHDRRSLNRQTPLPLDVAQVRKTVEAIGQLLYDGRIAVDGDRLSLSVDFGAVRGRVRLAAMEYVKSQPPLAGESAVAVARRMAASLKISISAARHYVGVYQREQRRKEASVLSVRPTPPCECGVRGDVRPS
jgi:hypothetical protein